MAVKDSFDAVDLKVSTVPFEYDGELFTICALQDISHEKRRLALERTFFHDVLNTAGGLRGYTELLLESEPDEHARGRGDGRRDIAATSSTRSRTSGR